MLAVTGSLERTEAHYASLPPGHGLNKRFRPKDPFPFLRRLRATLGKGEVEPQSGRSNFISGRTVLGRIYPFPCTRKGGERTEARRRVLKVKCTTHGFAFVDDCSRTAVRFASFAQRRAVPRPSRT